MRKYFALLSLLIFLAGNVVAEDSHDKLFGILNKNNDGALTKQEFLESGQHPVNREKAVQLFPGLKDSSHLTDEELRSRLFDNMDMNGDGLLSRDEWNKVAPNILEVRF